jgi:hypothetical protein
LSNIFVPIEISNLSEIIPEGENILYSTIYKVKVINATVGTMGKWKTHVLIKKSGFASFSRLEFYKSKSGKLKYRVKKKSEPPNAIFTRWEELPKWSGLIKNQAPFSKNRIVHVIGARNYVFYTDLKSKWLGDFCQELWFDIKFPP